MESTLFLTAKNKFILQKRNSVLRRKSIHHAKAQRKLLYMCIVICSAFALCSLPR